ncbi:MAG: serpin family protein [Bacteroidales bacterium]|jgi:serine protease inhibitor|nr:serpin family protein [Bacteroidales bacterium]MDD2264030.1 serpin family protein [Bacteroidales bacterium]MDD2831264.1 serpin family protein [Bacteroidales bacterium]MDD3208623.1 serpin family protein [Bacteroidales bacterium]MDD3697186.1 serpin family protein [Bacteroidales bacterium]
MKSVISLLITAVLAGPVAWSCSKWPDPIAREDIVLTKVQQEILENGNLFAIDLFREMSRELAGENLFISPLSASLALSAVTNGASGSTREDMKATLGFESFSMDDMNRFYKHLVPSLKKVDNTVKLLVANAVWIEQAFPVKTPFITALQEYYDASVNKLDFSDPSAPGLINKWCADNTNNLIKKVIDKIDPDCRLLYTNALYFKGKWKNTFDKKASWQGSFSSISGTPRSVTYMEQTNQFRYTAEKGVSVAEIPYGNEAFSMIIVLPDTGVDVMDVIASLSWEQWTGWVDGLSPAELNLRIPRFKMEFDSEKLMIPVLSRMGMGIAFDPCQADFSQISDIPLFIALLKQNTYIQVDEEGTEAAVVTTIGFNVTSIGPGDTIPFHVDRPFLYFIREKSTGTILFSGLMTDI